MKCNKIVFFINSLILFSILIETNTFSMEETYKLRSSICNKVSSCTKCTPSRMKNLKDPPYTVNDFVSYNVLSYEVPFVSGTEYFASPCNCEKIARVKKFCRDLDKSDPLPGLKNIDLRGILIKEEAKSVNDFRFKQRRNSKMKVTKQMRSIKRGSHECDCMVETDRRSLFCQDQCKIYTEYMGKIRSYYDEEVKTTEAWFDREMNKYK